MVLNQPCIFTATVVQRPRRWFRPEKYLIVIDKLEPVLETGDLASRPPQAAATAQTPGVPASDLLVSAQTALLGYAHTHHMDLRNMFEV